jgi:hypothetical protein
MNKSTIGLKVKRVMESHTRMLDCIDRKTKRQSRTASSDRKFSAYSHEGLCNAKADSTGALTWSF